MPEIGVQAPDGQVIYFAEGTGNGDIARVMRNYAGGMLKPQTPERESSMILPISYDQQGNGKFDTNAGLLGVMKRTFMAPGDVASGKIDAFGPEGAERAREMAGMIGSGPIQRLVRPGVAQIPTTQALKDTGVAGFKDAARQGVDYSADAAKSLAGDIQRALEADGFREIHSPKTFNTLKELQSPPEGSVASLEGLLTARRSFQKAAGDFKNKDDQAAASRAIEELDRFIAAADPQTIVAGAAAAPNAAKVLEDARGNFAAAQRSNTINGDLNRADNSVIDRAELQAAVANSGQNVANAIRQRFASILKDPKQIRGYTDEELDKMRKISTGTVPENAARYGGNLLGGGGGVGASVLASLGGSTGAAYGGFPGAVAGASLPLVGAGLKMAERGLQRRQVESLDEMLRKRSPLYQQMQRETPTQSLNPVQYEMMLRSLLMSNPDNLLRVMLEPEQQ